ncbi:MAG: hypothetical protein GX800_01045 [Clostridiaceae bacterium]|nr:hypothetical protein [Clostridiaceae bacterium]
MSKMKKPTVRQCKLIEKRLGLEPAKYLVKVWNPVKDGKIEVCLVSRKTGEKIWEMIIIA